MADVAMLFGALGAAGITALSLFGIGYFAGWLADRPPVLAGAHFLAVAAGAAGAGYAVGLGLSRLSGIPAVPVA